MSTKNLNFPMRLMQSMRRIKSFFVRRILFYFFIVQKLRQGDYMSYGMEFDIGVGAKLCN